MKRLTALLSSLLVAAGTLMPLASVSAAGANLIANPGFETAASNKPTDWLSDGWGTNSAAFTYENTGHTGSHSATVTMTNYKSGDAKWYFTPVNVTPGHVYTFTSWYKSTVKSSIDAAVTTTTGTTNYTWMSDPAISAAWKQQTLTFTAPANAKTVTFYHYLTKNGVLTVDDYSLTDNAGTTTPPPVNTPPTVSVTAPAASATVLGTVNVTANAGDDKGVTNVQFKVDGTNLGAADTTAPYSASWDTKTVANGNHTLTAVATDTENATTTSTAVTVNVQNVIPPTAPTVSLTAPAANATVTDTVSVTANAADAQGVKNVQFKLDGNNLGAADTTAPYSVSWDTKTIANGNHTLTAVATNLTNLTTTSAPVTVNVQNQAPATPPTVSVTAPAGNSTVSNTVSVTANAGGALPITSVQFKLDGANLGAVDTTAPYSASWDTKTATNGSHVLTATATNNANLMATSSNVTVNVSNTVVTPPTGNLIPNPSFETANGAVPASWVADGWGTNTKTQTYETNGQDGSRSVKTNITKYTNGDAKWYFAPVNVTPGTTYKYSEWYKASAATEVDAEVTMTDGTIQYFWLGSIAANTANWQQLNLEFQAPVGAKSVSIFHAIAAVGYLQIDNVSLVTYVPTQFNRALVSLNFDDGWRNIYTNGRPILNKYGMVSTQYLNSTPIVDGYPDYMTYQMVKDLAADGNELGWHTRTHADITTLTPAQLTTELTIPPAFLTGIGKTATDFKNFASPFGAYNPSSVAAVMQKYQSHRSTDVGYNTKDNLDVTNIKVQNITNTTTPADIQTWVNQAVANKSWLVILYHEVTTTAEDPTYAVTPTNLDAELNIIKQSGVAVKTMDQALAELKPQL